MPAKEEPSGKPISNSDTGSFPVDQEFTDALPGVKFQVKKGQNQLEKKIRGLRIDLERLRSMAEAENFATAFHKLKYPNPDMRIAIDPRLTAEQVTSSLSALAEFYRKCGGKGFVFLVEE